MTCWDDFPLGPVVRGNVLGLFGFSRLGVLFEGAVMSNAFFKDLCLPLRFSLPQGDALGQRTFCTGVRVPVNSFLIPFLFLIVFAVSLSARSSGPF